MNASFACSSVQASDPLLSHLLKINYTVITNQLIEKVKIVASTCCFRPYAPHLELACSGYFLAKGLLKITDTSVKKVDALKSLIIGGLIGGYVAMKGTEMTPALTTIFLASITIGVLGSQNKCTKQTVFGKINQQVTQFFGE